MIQSKEDYYEYLAADRKANHIPKYYNSIIMCRIWGGYNFLYLWYLRKLEYILNCKSVLVYRIYARLLFRRFMHWSAITGITIPPNTFGKGLYLPHWGSIVVNGSARFGDNCVVQSGVNISENVHGGNHIYLAAGAKVLMGVNIPDDVIVAANAVVNKNITEPNVVVGGIPASIISKKGYKDRLKV